LFALAHELRLGDLGALSLYFGALLGGLGALLCALGPPALLLDGCHDLGRLSGEERPGDGGVRIGGVEERLDVQGYGEYAVAEVFVFGDGGPEVIEGW